MAGHCAAVFFRRAPSLFPWLKSGSSNDSAKECRFHSMESRHSGKGLCWAFRNDTEGRGEQETRIGYRGYQPEDRGWELHATGPDERSVGSGGGRDTSGLGPHQRWENWGRATSHLPRSQNSGTK